MTYRCIGQMPDLWGQCSPYGQTQIHREKIQWMQRRDVDTQCKWWTPGIQMKRQTAGVILHDVPLNVINHSTSFSQCKESTLKSITSQQECSCTFHMLPYVYVLRKSLLMLLYYNNFISRYLPITTRNIRRYKSSLNRYIHVKYYWITLTNVCKDRVTEVVLCF